MKKLLTVVIMGYYSMVGYAIAQKFDPSKYTEGDSSWAEAMLPYLANIRLGIIIVGTGVGLTMLSIIAIRIMFLNHDRDTVISQLKPVLIGIAILTMGGSALLTLLNSVV